MVTTEDPKHSLPSFLSQVHAVTEDGIKPLAEMPPTMGMYPIGHSATFQSVFSAGSRVYREYDEAIRASLDNARYMRNDVGIMECIESRQRCVALLDWHLEPEDTKSHEQKELCSELKKILDRIRRFTEYRRNLQEAIWYGKYAIQHRYAWQNISGNMRLLPTPLTQDDPGWIPINGDKLVFRQDMANLPEGAYAGQMGIRVGTAWAAGDRLKNRWVVEATDRGSAYFLNRAERRTIAVHRHMIEDGAYEDGINAGSIHGVGIRSRIYWEWVQKQETLAFLMEYLERSAGGIELWSYPQGNQTAKDEVEEAAKKRIGGGKNLLLVPIPMGDEGRQYGVQVIEPGMAGIDTLKDILTNYFGHRIKRYCLGQVLSSEAEATGLGSGVADLHLDTLMQIIRYDAAGLEETITFELLDYIKKKNFPAASGIHIKFKINTQEPDVEKKLEGYARAYEMGARIKEQDVLDMIGTAIPGPEDRVLQRPDSMEKHDGPGGDQPAGRDPMAKMAAELTQKLASLAS